MSRIGPDREERNRNVPIAKKFALDFASKVLDLYDAAFLIHVGMQQWQRQMLTYMRKIIITLAKGHQCRFCKAPRYFISIQWYFCLNISLFCRKYH